MKKTSKAFGAVAISAAMAMAMAVPAFASDPQAGVNPGSEEAQKFVVQSDGSATNATTVDVLYKAKQINASVPLQATIVASGTPTKADKIMAPDKESYKITNNSETTKIQVTNVKSANETGKDWQLGETLTTSNGSGATGLLDLTLTGYSNGTTAGTVADLSDASAALGSAGVTTDWKADEKGSIYLEIDGYSQPNSTLQGAATGNTAAKTEAAFKVTYTLGLQS